MLYFFQKHFPPSFNLLLTVIKQRSQIYHNILTTQVYPTEEQNCKNKTMTIDTTTFSFTTLFVPQTKLDIKKAN